jgi:hypothetical protein
MKRWLIRDLVPSLAASMARERAEALATIERMRSNAQLAAGKGQDAEARDLLDEAAAVDLAIAGAAPDETALLADIQTLIDEGVLAARVLPGPRASTSLLDPAVYVTTLHRDRIKHYAGADADGKRAYLDELKDYQRTGWYTLAAAADSMGLPERYSVRLKRLIEAALQDLLPVYEPPDEEGSRIKCDFGSPPRRLALVDAQHHEAHCKDLNTWIEQHEAHISWRFPLPDGMAEVAAAAPTETETRIRGVEDSQRRTAHIQRHAAEIFSLGAARLASVTAQPLAVGSLVETAVRSAAQRIINASIAAAFPNPATTAPAGAHSHAGLNGGNGSSSAARSRRIGLQAQQELEILAALRTLRADPQALTDTRRTKAALRAHLLATNRAAWQGTVLNKAWTRLRKKGDIKDAAAPSILPK